MPQRDDDRFVPPVKTLRKRLGGVYRADGLTGPTRRYVLIVAMLVGLASLPTLAAITAGSNELDDGSTGALDVPFLPPASSGPVQPVRPPSSVPPASVPPASVPPASVPPASVPPASGLPSSVSPDDEGGAEGQAHEQRSKPDDPRYARSTPPRKGGRTPSRPGGTSATSESSSEAGSGSGSDGGSGSTGVPGSDGDAGAGGGPGSGDEAGSEQAGGPASPVEPGDPVSAAEPSDPDRPIRPDRLIRPGRPACHERGKCGARSSHHHRPDRSRHKQCETASRRVHKSHHRVGRKRAITVHIETTRERPAHQPKRIEVHRGKIGRSKIERRTTRRFVRIDDRHRSDDRSETTRRATVAERLQNVRPARAAERTHNSRRLRAESRPDDAQPANRSYLGSHRAERHHRAEDSHANRRNSGADRHQPEHSGHR